MEEEVIKIPIEQKLTLGRRINRVAVRLDVAMAQRPKPPRDKEYFLRLIELTPNYAKYGVSLVEKLKLTDEED